MSINSSTSPPMSMVNEAAYSSTSSAGTRSSAGGCSTADPSDEESDPRSDLGADVQAVGTADPGGDGEFSDSDTDSDRDEVILSVYWRNGKLGAATFSLQHPVVYILNDVPDDFLLGFKVLQSLFLQVQPTQVVTCKTMKHRFIHFLNNLLLGEIESVDQNLHGNLHILPDLEFRNDNGLRQVLALKLPGEPDDLPEEEHKNFMRSLVDVNQESMINAFARLLRYMNSNLAWLCLSHQQCPILGIRNLCIENQVWMNSESYKALQIFTHTAHPSLFKWTSDAHKEGLSIYGLFNRCHSKLGSKFMKATMLQPTTSIQELSKRHGVITFAMNPNNADIVRGMQGCIKQVQSISGMLPKLVAAQASIPQWKSLKKTNCNVLLLRDICCKYDENVPFFAKARTLVPETLYRVGHLIEKIIDFESSEHMKRFVVLPGVDTDLDKMKHTYASLPTVMMELSPVELQDLPEHIEECSVSFLPEIGFLLCVPMWKENLTAREMDIPGYRFKFIVNQMIHYKSPRCRELDSSLGDIYLRICELELRIMLRLVQFIQQHIDALLNSLSYVAELDCLLAFADVAKEFGYIKPKMTSGHEMLIEKGRHPLQECCVSNFVPNDTFSSAKDGLVKILTGPNASGKSVYLKQVAVIAYLAHIGSFLPAKKAVVGVLDQIHTRIQTTESAASQLSAFLIDLRQMNTAVTMSTKSSLLVVDEFGKGTSEVDGLSLLTSFLTHLIQRGPSHCPHVVLSTHFHRLVDLIGDSPLLRTLVLEHMVSDGELVYLFQLKPGQIRSSLAIDVAKANGIPDKLSNRASEILNTLRGGSPVKPIKGHKKMCLSKIGEIFMREFCSKDSIEATNLEEFKKTIADLKIQV